MARRANLEGNIRQRGDLAWEGSISLQGRRFYVRGKTRTEVQRKLSTLRKDNVTGELVTPTRLTVAEYLTYWLEDSRLNWKPKTHQEYESVVRIYAIPTLGHHKLQALTPSQLSSAYARWQREREVAGGTILNVHRVLHRALRVAVLHGLLGRNPADNVEPPKAVRRLPDLWTPDQGAKFVSCIGDGPFDALWALLLGTGCRLGEAIGARWEDLDFDGRTLTIRRSITWVKRQPLEGTPKTRAGTRRLALPDFSLRALGKWRATQSTLRLQHGADWLGEDRIISLANGASPAPWVCRNHFERRCAELGIERVRLHDMRHSHASLLLASGLPLPVVSARLGHANTAVTASIYSHALKGADTAAASAIEAALGLG